MHPIYPLPISYTRVAYPGEIVFRSRLKSKLHIQPSDDASFNTHSNKYQQLWLRGQLPVRFSAL